MPWFPLLQLFSPPPSPPPPTPTHCVTQTLHIHVPPVLLFADTVSQKLRNSNIFTIAKRNVEGQDMLYQSLKLSNGIKVLAELKIAPSNPNFTVSHRVGWSPHPSAGPPAASCACCPAGVRV